MIVQLQKDCWKRVREIIAVICVNWLKGTKSLNFVGLLDFRIFAECSIPAQWSVSSGALSTLITDETNSRT